MRGESKETILKKIREGGKRKHSMPPTEDIENPFIEKKETYSRSEIIKKFETELERVGGECYVCKTTEELVEKLKKVTSRLKTKKILITDNIFEEYGLEKNLLGIEIASSTSSKEISEADTGITHADYAIAESGTLVLISSDKNPRSYSLLPKNHIVLIKADKIVHSIHTLFSILKQRYHTIANISSCITFITGPSRTADIELNLTLGVHGPEKVIAFIII